MPNKPDEKNSTMKPPETMAFLVWKRFRRRSHPDHSDHFCNIGWFISS